MSPAARRPVLVLVLLLVAAAAGCQSPTAPATETPRPDATTEAEPTSPSRWDIERHEQTVRDAGNATIVFKKEFIGPGYEQYQNGTVVDSRTQVQRLRVDFESGRVRESFHPVWGTGYTAYRNGTGIRFERTNATGRYMLGDNPRFSVERVLTPFPADIARLEDRGRGTVDGVTGRAYTVPSFDALGDGVYEGFDANSVTNFSATYVIDERGYVAYSRLRLTVPSDTGHVTIVESIRTRDLGNTTVEPPEWFDEAKAETEAR